MRQFTMILMIALLGLANIAYGADEPKYVSKTFAEIQSRISRREPESGAIMEVKAKADAPTAAGDLSFSITKTSGDEAVIVLEHPLKSGDGVYEKYRLRLDDAMRQELKNQKRLVDLDAQRQIDGIKKAKATIPLLTDGKLHYGMTREEATTVMGPPEKFNDHQMAGSFTLIYSNFHLMFGNDILVWVEQIKE